MPFTKKIGRAVQWAGEKMGSEAKTSHSEEFQRLEAEMALRQEGMESLQKSSSVYMKWISRRCDASEDKSRAPPTALLGRSMTAHGNDFESDSEFGTALVSLGRAHERIANLHSNYSDDVNANWVHHVDRNVAAMKDYQGARKKLESRRLAYDASVAKMHKAKKDDFRIEEEVRVSKTKFDDASEDVTRRMQDIQDTEPESISALASFLEAELNYHERAAEELRRVQQAWVQSSQQIPREPLQVSRARSNTSRSWQGGQPSVDAGTVSPVSERLPMRRMPSSMTSGPPPALPGPTQPGRLPFTRSSTYGSQPTPLATFGRGPPVMRAGTDTGLYGHGDDDVFRDDESTGSGDGSVGWGARSASSATSCDSILRVASGGSSPAVKKAPPPPPPSRSKKPPPPVPTRKAHLA